WGRSFRSGLHVSIDLQAAAGEPRAELAPSVVERLVEGSSSRVQASRQDIDGNVVQRDRDEHVSLVGGEVYLDRLLQSPQDLAQLDIVLWQLHAIGDHRPARGLELHLAALPYMPADLDRGLQQRELVGPGGEATVAAEVRELAQ